MSGEANTGALHGFANGRLNILSPREAQKPVPAERAPSPHRSSAAEQFSRRLETEAGAREFADECVKWTILLSEHGATRAYLRDRREEERIRRHERIRAEARAEADAAERANLGVDWLSRDSYESDPFQERRQQRALEAWLERDEADDEVPVQFAWS